jgi:hypothetical protein
VKFFRGLEACSLVTGAAATIGCEVGEKKVSRASVNENVSRHLPRCTYRAEIEKENKISETY